MVDCAIFMYANENLNLFYNMLFHNYTLNPITPGGGGLARPPLGVISCHSVVDAPTNSKFLDFSQLHPFFHLIK